MTEVARLKTGSVKTETGGGVASTFILWGAWIFIPNVKMTHRTFMCWMDGQTGGWFGGWTEETVPLYRGIRCHFDK